MCVCFQKDVESVLIIQRWLALVTCDSGSCCDALIIQREQERGVWHVPSISERPIHIHSDIIKHGQIPSHPEVISSITHKCVMRGRERDSMGTCTFSVCIRQCEVEVCVLWMMLTAVKCYRFWLTRCWRFSPTHPRCTTAFDMQSTPLKGIMDLFVRLYWEYAFCA